MKNYTSIPYCVSHTRGHGEWWHNKSQDSVDRSKSLLRTYFKFLTSSTTMLISIWYDESLAHHSSAHLYLILVISLLPSTAMIHPSLRIAVPALPGRPSKLKTKLTSNWRQIGYSERPYWIRQLVLPFPLDIKTFFNPGFLCVCFLYFKFTTSHILVHLFFSFPNISYLLIRWGQAYFIRYEETRLVLKDRVHNYYLAFQSFSASFLVYPIQLTTCRHHLTFCSFPTPRLHHPDQLIFRNKQSAGQRVSRDFPDARRSKISVCYHMGTSHFRTALLLSS